MWGRCQLEGDQVVYVVDPENATATAKACGVFALASRVVLGESDEITDPMGMIVSPDPANTSEGVKNSIHGWLLEQGCV